MKKHSITRECDKCLFQFSDAGDDVTNSLAVELMYAKEQIERLRILTRLLADKLACHVGSTIPMEMREAEHAEKCGGEYWDHRRKIYVDDSWETVRPQ